MYLQVEVNIATFLFHQKDGFLRGATKRTKAELPFKEKLLEQTLHIVLIYWLTTLYKCLNVCVVHIWCSFLLILVPITIRKHMIDHIC